MAKKVKKTTAKKRKKATGKQLDALKKGQSLSKKAVAIMRASGTKTVTKTVFKKTLPQAMKEAKQQEQRIKGRKRK